LFINRVDRHYEGATLGRLLRSAGKDIVLWDNVLGKPGPERRFDARTKPCTDKRVRLRLKRVGNQLSYLLGPGLEGESFEELPEKQFGNDGIAQIALIATTGNQPVGVDVRWIDLRIRSHRVHGDAPSTMQIAETPRLFSRVWLVVALFGVFGVVLSLAAAKYLKRKRQHSDGKAVGFWTSTCSNCGKPLKARAELAGKNVKCPICGAIAKVAAQATEGRVADAPE
jgi:phage FluMu protein Com